jgi:hypothetical protein
LDDALRDYEYYEETTTIKPVAEVTSDAVNPVTTLVNETNRLMLDLNSKYLEVADQAKKTLMECPFSTAVHLLSCPSLH